MSGSKGGLQAAHAGSGPSSPGSGSALTAVRPRSREHAQDGQDTTTGGGLLLSSTLKR